MIYIEMYNHKGLFDFDGYSRSSIKNKKVNGKIKGKWEVNKISYIKWTNC